MIGIFHRDVSGCDVGDHLGDEEGVVFRACRGVHCIISGFLLKSVEAADASCHNYSNAVAVEVLLLFDAGIFHSLAGCHDGILCVEVKLTQFLTVEVVGCIEAFYLTRKLGFEQRSVEMCNRTGSAYAFDCVFPCSGNVVTERGYGAETCYDYSFKFHVVSVV